MNKYNLKAPLTDIDILNLNRMSQQGGFIIVFENTKGLTIDTLRKLNNNIM